ncbi:MAG: hypothetical protein QG564_1814 [Campylobacterota bacterium]|nr:hypothetical protein [Campylobacterota bacterium]
MSILSKRQLFQQLSKEEQIRRIMKMSDDEAEKLFYDWDWNARPQQRTPDGDWMIWLVMAGRGFGKTRVGAEWIKEQVKTNKYVNLIGATSDDAKQIMVQGESGILSVCDRWDRPTFKNGQLYWPNGAISLIFSAEEPDRMRGKQHMKLWADELAAWRYPDAWDQVFLGLRLGKNPQACITTTPRPTKLIKDLIKEKSTIITRGSTFDNKNNLAPSFLNKIIDKYEGTRLGRQEIYAEVLEENENALWTLKQIDDLRVENYDSFSRIVVAIDPAVTSSAEADFTGIVVAGKGEDGHYYIIKDLTVLAKPADWARVAINAYYDYKADRIIAETNNGGDMIEDIIRNLDGNVSYKKVTATRGKILRAEPISALYEQGKVHHIGMFGKLEDQMVNYTGDTKQKSPDRLDALVWALTELSENKNGGWIDFIDEENTKKKEETARSSGGWF